MAGRFFGTSRVGDPPPSTTNTPTTPILFLELLSFNGVLLHFVAQGDAATQKRLTVPELSCSSRTHLFNAYSTDFAWLKVVGPIAAKQYTLQQCSLQEELMGKGLTSKEEL